MPSYENILLLGYLTDDNDMPIRPVIGMPFIPRTLFIPQMETEELFRIAINDRLNVTDNETVIYDFKTYPRNPRYQKQFTLVVLKPGFREQVREFLKGGIVWVSTGGLVEHLEVMRRPRARLYRSYILAASRHDDIAIFKGELEKSKVGT